MAHSDAAARQTSRTSVATYRPDPLLVAVPPGAHLVYFYQDHEILSMAVADFIGEGLRQQQLGLVIAPPPHRAGFRRALGALGIDVATAERDERLLVLDADTILSSFLVQGWPHWERFQDVVGGILQKLTRGGVPVLAHGEMVDLLQQRGCAAEAAQLEKLWTRLGSSYPFTLMCAYYLDSLDPEAAHHVEDIGCAHTHVIPVSDSSRLTQALNQALSENIGVDSQALRAVLAAASQEPAMPDASKALLWLQKNVPQVASSVVERTRQLYYHSTTLPIC